MAAGHFQPQRHDWTPRSQIRFPGFLGAAGHFPKDTTGLLGAKSDPPGSNMAQLSQAQVASGSQAAAESGQRLKAPRWPAALERLKLSTGGLRVTARRPPVDRGPPVAQGLPVTRRPPVARGPPESDILRKPPRETHLKWANTPLINMPKPLLGAPTCLLLRNPSHSRISTMSWWRSTEPWGNCPTVRTRPTHQTKIRQRNRASLENPAEGESKRLKVLEKEQEMKPRLDTTVPLVISFQVTVGRYNWSDSD